MKTLTLRLLPYAISFVIGLVLFVVAEFYIRHESLNGLVMSMAAALLSVPVMFICYELIKSNCERRLKDSLRSHLCFELNHHVIHVLSCIKRFVDIDAGEITADNLDNFVSISKNTIQQHLNTDKISIDEFSNTKNAIHSLMYNEGHANVLSDYEVHLVLSLAKQIGIVSSDLKRNDNNRKELVESVFTLLKLIGKWVELQEEEFTLHRDFRFVNDWKA